MPTDLPAGLKGTTVVLPVGEESVETVLTDKSSAVSGPRIPTLAKERFTLAYGAFARQLDAMFDLAIDCKLRGQD